MSNINESRKGQFVRDKEDGYMPKDLIVPLPADIEEKCNWCGSQYSVTYDGRRPFFTKCTVSSICLEKVKSENFYVIDIVCCACGLTSRFRKPEK